MRIGTILALTLVGGLTACASSNPSLGEQLSADAQARTELADQAVRGEELIRRGERLVARGQRRVRRGENEVNEGRALIERGEGLVRDVRRSANTGAGV